MYVCIHILYIYKRNKNVFLHINILTNAKESNMKRLWTYSENIYEAEQKKGTAWDLSSIKMIKLKMSADQ